MSELKPCPFCGGKGHIYRNYSAGGIGIDGHFIMCENCRAESPFDLSESDTGKSWNTRPIEDALRAELEKAKERELTTCKWSPDPDDDTWNGDCGAKWTLEYDDPKTNGMNYCPVCGKRLEQVGDYSY